MQPYTIPTAFKSTLSHPRLVIFFYLSNLLCTGLLFLPLKKSIDEYAGHSLFAESLSDGFSLKFLLEYLAHNSGEFGTAMALLPVVLVASFIAGTLLSSGALAVFLSGGGYDSRLFWSTAATNFWPIMRLTLWMAPLVTIGGLVLGAAYWAIDSFLPERATDADLFWAFLPLIAIGGLIGLLLLTIYDYGKVEVIAQGQHRTRHAVLRATALIARHPFRTAGFLLVMTLLGLAVLVIAHQVAGGFTFTGAGIPFFIITLQQLTLLCRQFIKTSRYAGVAFLYKQLTPSLPVDELSFQPEAEVTPDAEETSPSDEPSRQ